MNTSKIEKVESKIDRWVARNPRKTGIMVGVTVGLALVAASYAGASFAHMQERK